MSLEASVPQWAAAVGYAGAIGVVPSRSKHWSNEEYNNDSDDEVAPQNAKLEEEKKSKPNIRWKWG